MLCRLAAVALLWLATQPAAHAHVHRLVAQHGTLDIVSDNAHMKLSLPVSAFPGADDNDDGMLSSAELRAHRSDIADAVMRDVQLMDAHGPYPLEALRLGLSPEGELPDAPASQLLATGRFALAAPSAQETELSINVGLFGETEAQRTLELAITRGPQEQVLLLTPERQKRALLPSASSAFADELATGAEHTFSGFDHLALLLVVLIGSACGAQVLLALTVFGIGHAAALMASVIAGLWLPALIAEPVIAATLVSLAVLDALVRRGGAPPLPWLRLGLVFACALVHGLGVASALNPPGTVGWRELASLAGFNVGIEMAQIGTALTLVAVAWGVRRLRGDGGRSAAG